MVNFHFIPFLNLFVEKRSKDEGSAPSAEVCNEEMKEVVDLLL